MRKISKAVLYRPGDDSLHVRPRGVSGATITSWRERRDIDLAKLFSKPADQVSVAASVPVSDDGRKSADSRDDTPSTLAAAPDKSLTVVIV